MLQTVLVTGSTGFVGAKLCHLLSNAVNPPVKRWHVRALHRPSSRLDTLEGAEIEHALGDVNDSKSLKQAMQSCQIVFHMAAVADYWRQDIDKLYHVNVQGTRNVCQAALEAGVEKLVFTSSVAAIGITGDKPADENIPFNIPPERFRYGHSKFLAEGVVAEFVARGLDAVIVNPSIVLGPGDLNQISGSMVVEAARGHLPPFTAPGGANYIHVNDVCAGHMAAAEKGRTGERYILGGHNLSHAEVQRIVCEIVGCSPPRWVLPRATIVPLAALLDIAGRLSPRPLPLSGEQLRLSTENIYVDNSKAVRELGLPQTPFRTMVKETYAWYKQKGII